MFTQVLITPEAVAALSNVILAAVSKDASPDAEAAYKWLAYVRESLYNNWQALPDGSHLKDAYRDEVWSWSDLDLAEPSAPKKV